MAESNITHKTCTKCGERKPVALFHHKGRANARREAECKACHAVRVNVYCHTTQPECSPGSDLPGEEWRDCAGYEGRYRVSNQGRVLSLLRSNTSKGRLKHLLAFPSIYGYPQVCLRAPGVQKLIRVHTLVMAAFVGPRPEGAQVNHMDCDKTNNRLENLEYCTLAENIRHATLNGLRASGLRSGRYTKPERTARGDRHGTHLHPGSLVRGEAHHNAKLTPEIVREIRVAHAAGGTYEGLGRQFGIHACTVKSIVLLKTWRHVDP